MKKYLIEFIGTFFLVLTVAFTGNPIAIGAILIAMVYMGGHISGAQYNPAVTLALLIRRKMELRESLIYMATQILAGFVAALLYVIVNDKSFLPAPGVGVGFTSALLMEIAYTFALCSVVLHVATTKKIENNQYFGLAIGLTVMAGAFAAGPISGGAFNPAVAIGPLLADASNLSRHFTDLILYIVGPFTGAILAGYLYNYLNLEK
jgi:aquaporin Z